MPLNFYVVATTYTNLHVAAVVMNTYVMCAMLPVFDVGLLRSVAIVGEDACVNIQGSVLCELVLLAGTL